MTGIQLANYRQGSEIQICPDLECIGIHNDVAHRIWNGQKMVGFNWSRFRMGSEIRNSNHLKTDKNSHHLVFTIWNLDYLVRILHESNFQIIETKTIAIDKAQTFEIRPSKSPDFKCFKIFNGWISATHCIWIQGTLMTVTVGIWNPQPFEIWRHLKSGLFQDRTSDLRRLVIKILQV